MESWKRFDFEREMTEMIKVENANKVAMAYKRVVYFHELGCR